MKLYILPQKNKTPDGIVKRWVLIFFLIILVLQCWRVFSLNATYDQGLFLQEIWNTLHGRAFESTLAAELSTPVKFNNEIPQLGYKHLAQHFTPLLIIWTPIIGVLGIWALPLIQSSLLALSGWILFLLGKEHLPGQLAGWIACSYFATGTVIGPSLENFHDLCLVPLLVFSLLLGISKNQKITYFIPAFLLPLVREDVGLLSFSIGLWLIIRQPKWRTLGVGLCLYSIISVIIITNWVMPYFGSELSTRFMQERFGQYLSESSGGTITVLKSMVSQPFLLLKELIFPINNTIKFIITLGLPLAFIPWLSIDTWILISVPLFVALSSQGGNALSVHLRFVLYIVPGIFAGGIYWWKENILLFKGLKLIRFWKFCLVIAFIFALAGNPHRSLSFLIPDSVHPWVYVPIHKQFYRGFKTKKILDNIPKDASIAAETHLIPQLAQRRVLMRFPENTKFRDLNGTINDVDMIISQPRFNLDYAPAFRHQARWVKKSLESLEALTSNNKYSVFHCDKQTIIIRKNHTSNEAAEQCFKEEVNQIRASLKNILKEKYNKI